MIKIKGNKKIIIASLLLILVITLSFTTYAFYKNSVTGSSPISTAAWVIQFKNGQTEITQNTNITFNSSDCSNAHTAQGYIAPGVTCTKQILIDATGTQVDVNYSATAGTITATKNNESVSTSGANAFTVSFSPSNSTIAHDANDQTATITITVTWGGDDDSSANPANVKNDADTNLNGATINVPVTLVARQVTGN